MGRRHYVGVGRCPSLFVQMAARRSPARWSFPTQFHLAGAACVSTDLFCWHEFFSLSLLLLCIVVNVVLVVSGERVHCCCRCLGCGRCCSVVRFAGACQASIYNACVYCSAWRACCNESSCGWFVVAVVGAAVAGAACGSECTSADIFQCPTRFCAACCFATQSGCGPD